MKAALLAMLACLPASGQPSYDAASIKPNHFPSEAMGGVVGIRTGGSVSMRNVTLVRLISIAYQVEEFRVTSGPSWLAVDRYDVDAKPAGRASNADARLMLQNLLAERFKLKLHRETRTVDGYTLLAPNAAAKMQKSPPADGVGFRHAGASEIRGSGTMANLARYLKEVLGAPVEDGTNLSDVYLIDLAWSADDGVPDGRPTIFAALKEQLGLTLKRNKVPQEFLVVDQAERATPN